MDSPCVSVERLASERRGGLSHTDLVDRLACHSSPTPWVDRVTRKLTLRQSIRRATLTTLAVLFVLWVVGQITRDATGLSALCFYIPSLFLACAFSCLAVWECARKRARAALLTAILAVPPLFWVGFVENSFSRPTRSATSNPVRLVHWNLYDAKLGWSAITTILLSLSADVYVFAEIPEGHAQQFAGRCGEAYRAVEFDNLAVVVRGSIESHDWLVTRGGAKFYSLKWRNQERVTSLIVVDLISDIWVARNPLLDQLRDVVKREQPDLVVGDFNAPRRSLVLADLPDGYEHAYRSVGSGFGYTWPVPVPMYSLDHCIHGPRITPLAYELRSTIRSDHRLQIFDYSFSWN